MADQPSNNAGIMLNAAASEPAATESNSPQATPNITSGDAQTASTKERAAPVDAQDGGSQTATPDKAPNVANNIAALRSQGVGWDEINNALTQERATAHDKGISDKEFNEALGIPTPPEGQQYFSMADIANHASRAFINYLPGVFASLVKDANTIYGEQNIPPTAWGQIEANFNKASALADIPVQAFNAAAAPVLAPLNAGLAGVSTAEVNLETAVSHAITGKNIPPEVQDYWQKQVQVDLTGAMLLLGPAASELQLGARAKLSPILHPNDTLDAATAVIGDPAKMQDNLATVANNLHDNWVKTGEPPLQAAQRALTDPELKETLQQPGIKTPVLATPGINIEGPLSRPAALKDVPEFENQLFQLRTNQIADRIDALKTVESLPDVPPETWEKLYHYSEDKSILLTDHEQGLYDQYVKPLHEENAKLFQELDGKGYTEFSAEEKPGEAGYTPRYVQDRTRSLGEMLARAKQGLQSTFSPTSTRSLRSTVDAQKARRFYAIEQPGETEGAAPTRSVVYINTDHHVIGFNEPGKPGKIGTFKDGQKVAAGSEVKVKGQTYQLKQATTKEIEASTNIKYNKNVIANELDQNVKLKSALRNAQYLEAVKSSPDFEKIATEVNKNAVPPTSDGRQWRTPKLIQFRNYYVEPKLADAMDDFAKEMGSPDGLAQGMLSIQRASNRLMFLNPLPHIENVFNHFMVDKGLVGNVTSIPSTLKSLYQAVGEVSNFGPKYMEALRTGMSMPYAQFMSEDLNSKLIAKMGYEIGMNPSYWSSISDKLGYANPIELFKRWSDASQHALWYANDVLTTSRMLQLQEKGLKVEDAIRQTEDLIPNYRVPSEILGQRWISQMFNNPLMARFGRYGYNKLDGFFSVLSDPLTTKGFANKAQAIDRLAMLGVYMYVLYPMFDKAWQTVTGNPNASETRSGMAQPAQAFMDTFTGQKKIGDLPLSLYTPGMPVEMPVEMATGRYMWNGQPIIRQEDVNNGRSQALVDAANYLGSKFSYLGQAGAVAEGKMTPGQMGLGLMGVKSPTDKQVQTREYYKTKDAKAAAKRAEILQKQRDGQ